MSTVTAPTLTPERVTPIKPSEALRLGRLTRPMRIEGLYFESDNGACAIGAMLVGVGYPAREGTTSIVRDWLPGLADRQVGCPLCEGLQAGADSIVIHLNDEHHWPDDQIVAWLEGLGL